MAKRVFLSTTGTKSTIRLDDLGGRTFEHPTSEIEISTEYQIDDLAYSDDLQTEIDSGNLTLKDGNDNLISKVINLLFPESTDGTINYVPSSTSGFFNEELTINEAFDKLSKRLTRPSNVRTVGLDDGNDFKSFEDAVDWAKSIALDGSSALIKMNPGLYEFNNPITISGNIVVYGSGMDKTVLRPKDTTKDGIIVDDSIPTGSGGSTRFEDFGIFGVDFFTSSENTYLLKLIGGNSVHMDRMIIRNYWGGLYVDVDTQNSTHTFGEFGIGACQVGLSLNNDSRLVSIDFQFVTNNEHVVLNNNSSLVLMSGQFRNTISLPNSVAITCKNSSSIQIVSSIIEDIPKGICGYDTADLNLESVKFKNCDLSIHQNDDSTFKILTDAGIGRIEVEDPSNIRGINFSNIDGINTTDIYGNLNIGTADTRSELSVGYGGPTRDGLLIFTEDGDGNFTDVSNHASFFSIQNIAFPDIESDNAIYITTTKYNKNLPTQIKGLEILLESEPNLKSINLGTGKLCFEYWDGDEWKELKYMVVEKIEPFLPKGKKAFTDKSQDIRFENKIQQDWQMSDPVGLVVGYFWIRIRIKEKIQLSPQIKRMRYHTSHSKFNYNGWVEHFGNARPIKKLDFDVNLFSPSRNSPEDRNIYLSEYLTVGRKENSFKPYNLSQSGMIFYLPYEMDTSEPMIIQFTYRPRENANGNVMWKIHWGWSKDEESVYNAVWEAPQVSGNEKSLELVKDVSDSKHKQFTSRFLLDVSDAIARDRDGIGDIIWITLSREGNDPLDTFTNTVDLIELSPLYSAWSTGGHTQLFEKKLEVLWVCGDKNNLTDKELAAISKYREASFVVNVINDIDSSASSSIGQSIVIISETCSPTNVLGKFRDVKVPVIVGLPDIYQDMNMSGPNSTDWGYENFNELEIINNTHPVTQMFQLQSYSAISSISGNWARLDDGLGTPLAKSPTNNDKIVIFLYEKNQLGYNNFVMPAKRVGVGFFEFFWFDQLWANRIEFSIASNKVSSDVQNFPLYFDLSLLPNSFWNNVQVDGRDIRITTKGGVKNLPIELISFDHTNKNGYLFFKTDLLGGQQNNFYIYFNNPNANPVSPTDLNGQNHVWDDYLAVWHCQENSGNLLDSTGNGNTMKPLGSPRYDRNGKFYDAIEINVATNDGEDAFWTKENIQEYNNLRDFSVDTWLYIEEKEKDARIIQRPKDEDVPPDADEKQFDWALQSDDLKPVLADANTWNPGSYRFTERTWHFFGATRRWNDQALKRYVDGQELQSHNISYIGFGDYPIMIGGGKNKDVYKGKLQEIRISKVLRSKEWYDVQYDNINDSNFYSIGSTEVKNEASNLQLLLEQISLWANNLI